MRTTYRTINRHMQYVILDRYSDLAKLQQQLSTGKRLLRPSDNPTDVANDLQLRSKMKQLDQLKKNITDGQGFMTIADTAMMSMDTLLQRIRELAVQASTETLSAKERLFIASEVDQLLRQFVSLSNTRFKGDFVFAGTQTKITPFPMKTSQAGRPENYSNFEMAYYDATVAGAAPGVPIQIQESFTDFDVNNIIPGTFKLIAGGTQYFEGTDYTIDYAAGTITINASAWAALGVDVSAPANYMVGGFEMTFEYIGKGVDVYGDQITSDGDVLREIESGVITPININANELLIDSTTGNNLLETIVAFGQGLIQNVQADIVSSITNIDIGFNTLLAAQAKNGSRMNRFDITIDRNEGQSIETTRLHSELEDAELAETATRFAIAETVYNAALQSAAKIIQPSLVNFL